MAAGRPSASFWPKTITTSRLASVSAAKAMISPCGTRITRVTEKTATSVAAGVVAGLTADEIGDWLGIAATSVITHRKRAYERLGVANQRELLQAFYAS